MAEYEVHGFRVIAKDGEIEITQDHLFGQEIRGVILGPDEVEILIKRLEWAVRDLQEELDRAVKPR